LEGNDGSVARHYRGHLVTHFDDLNDTLVAEGVGPQEREAASENGNVKVTGGYRDWTYQRRARTRKRWIRDFLPDH